MKFGMIVIIVLVFLLVGFVGFAKGKQEDPGTGEKGISLTALETYSGLSTALMNGEEVVVYDVRTAEEYAAGHIPGAVNIPYDVIGSEIPITDMDAAIVVYCQSGNRSGRARSTLERLGYTNIADFGAVSKWLDDLTLGNEP